MRRDFVVYAGHNDVFAHFFECSMTAFDHALELISTLPREEQNELEEILRKRRIEERREEIAANGCEANAEDAAGKLRSETAENLILRLRTLVTNGETAE